LKTYTSKSTEATDALGDLNLDEDGLSDEYDFMEDVSNEPGRATRRQAQQQHPKLKYMQQLKEVSNRTKDQILIELDDLAEVCSFYHSCTRN
jgi:DNA replication licensing factor MCM7